MKTILIIIAYVSWVPIVWLIAKSAQGILGKFTGAINNTSKGLFDRNKNFRANSQKTARDKFMAGERGVGGLKRVGLGIGVVKGMSPGTRKTLLSREGRAAALVNQNQKNAAENTQKNPALQQLMQSNDDAGAIMQSGRSQQTAEAARARLQESWLAPERDRINADASLTAPERDQQLAQATAEVEQRGDRAFNAARAVGFNRRNALSAQTLLAQNKSRSIGENRSDLIEAGIQATASNAQEAEALRNNFQFHSRNAGRYDLGGGGAITATDGNAVFIDPATGNARTLTAAEQAAGTAVPAGARVLTTPGGGINRAGIYQIANSHPRTITGAAAQYTEVLENPGATYTDSAGNVQQMYSEAMQLQAARYFSDLRAALPQSTGEARDAIATTLRNLDTSVNAANENIVEAWMNQPTPTNNVRSDIAPVMADVSRPHPTVAGATMTTREQARDPVTGKARWTQRQGSNRRDEVMEGTRRAMMEDSNNPNRTTPPIPSDRRLKKNAYLLGINPNGIGIYRFKYVWSDVEYVGVMAQDLLSTHPEAVSRDQYGFYQVDYMVLGLEMMSYEQWKLSQKSTTKNLTVV